MSVTTCFREPFQGSISLWFYTRVSQHSISLLRSLTSFQLDLLGAQLQKDDSSCSMQIWGDIQPAQII